MRFLITLGVILAFAHASSADAQLPKRIGQAIKQKLGDTKRGMEDSLTKRVTEPVDSALIRSNRVDSLAAKASAKAGEVVSKVGRGPGTSAEEKAVRSALASGRLDIRGVTFSRGKSDLAMSLETLQLLAKVLRGVPNVFLVQGRADPGLTRAAAQKLAEQRAAAFKAALMGQGVPAQRLFAAGDGIAQPGGGFVSLLRVQ